MDTITDRELLTEGSVWIREDGKENVVLFTTNTTLSPKQQQKNPPQVIYVDKTGKKYNKDVSAFLGERTFLNVNPLMERRSLELTVNMNDDLPEDDEETLTLTLAEDEVVDPIDDSQETAIAGFFGNNAVVDADSEIAEQAPAANGFGLTFFPMTENTNALVTAEQLQAAFAAYEVTPNLERAIMIHALTFECSNFEEANNIFRSFHGENSEHNVLYGFNVSSPVAVQSVQWNQSIGGYPVMMGDNNYIKILVATPSPVPVNANQETAVDNSEAAPVDLLERVEAVIAKENLEVGHTEINSTVIHTQQTFSSAGMLMA